MSTEERIVKMDASDKRHMIFGFVVTLLASTFIGGVIYIMFREANVEEMKYVLYFFMAFFAFILYSIFSKTIRPLMSGKKIVLRGVVEKKEEEIIRRRKKTDSYHYYLHFNNGRKVEVKRSFFNKCTEGDLVEVHFPEGNITSFSLEVLAHNNKPEEKPEVLPPYTDVLNIKDQEELLRYRKSYTRHRVLILAALTWIVGPFLYQGYWGIALLFFPIPLIGMFVLYRLISKRNLIQKDLEQKKKTVYRTYVSQKLLRSGRGKSNRIITPVMRFNVTSAEFEQFKIGQRVDVQVAKHSKFYLGYLLK